MLSPATSSKKIKKSSSSSKKQHSNKFPRIFTEEDELIILEAVLENIQEDPPIPARAADVIFNGIQNKITAQVNKIQLGEKMRKMRDKYWKGTNEKLNPHQEKVSILCKKIWGIKKNLVKQKTLEDDDIRNAKEDDFVKNYPYLMKEVSKASNNFVSINTLRYLDRPRLQQLNERWRKQHFVELQIFLERVDLTKEHAKLVLDAHTSSSKGKDDAKEAMAVDDAYDEEAMAVDDADDELVGDNDDENEQSEDLNEEEAEVDVEVKVESDDENEQSEDVNEEEEAEVEVKVESDDENEQSKDVNEEEEAEVEVEVEVESDDENEQSEDVNEEEEAEVEVKSADENEQSEDVDDEEEAEDDDE